MATVVLQIPVQGAPHVWMAFWSTLVNVQRERLASTASVRTSRSTCFVDLQIHFLIANTEVAQQVLCHKQVKTNLSLHVKLEN